MLKHAPKWYIDAEPYETIVQRSPFGAVEVHRLPAHVQSWTVPSIIGWLHSTSPGESTAKPSASP